MVAEQTSWIGTQKRVCKTASTLQTLVTCVGALVILSTHYYAPLFDPLKLTLVYTI
ncbi:hypothetical protein Plhal304r1_c031g0101251 [Plasmopara halstedii]